MTDVNWDELDRVTATPVHRTWKVNPLAEGLRHLTRNVDWYSDWHTNVSEAIPDEFDAEEIVALHNAFPAIRERVRELEAVKVDYDEVRFGGGCKCVPPGSGEEFCVGTCFQRARAEQAEARLRELEARNLSSTADAGYAALKEAADRNRALTEHSRELEARLREAERVVKASGDVERRTDWASDTLTQSTHDAWVELYDALAAYNAGGDA